MPKLYKLSFNIAEQENDIPLSRAPLFKNLLNSANESLTPDEFTIRPSLMSDEHASRLYLQSFLLGMDNDAINALSSPERPSLAPDFTLQEAADVRLTKSRAVAFQQTEKAIPIFGARTIIEIDGSAKSLLSIEASLSEKPNVSAIAKISPETAFANILAYGKASGDIKTPDSAPELVFFPDQKNDMWHLAYHFSKIPVFPPDFDNHHDESAKNFYCIQNSPRHHAPFHDYFVDAHTGEVFYYFSSAPRMDIPVRCQGIDDETMQREFYGLQNTIGVALKDPLRNLVTYDFKLQDVDSPVSTVPSIPVTHTAPDFSTINTAAVSAHYNAALVFDFFNNELKRNSIDDKGMVLESVVNVYASGGNPNPAPDWGNAMWWNNKMWYGQKAGAGANISFARYLDIIGHELTHGVTETSSNLVYRDLSGALNESFSDIFGIFIKNWYPNQPNDIAMWNWEMGPGLGSGGGPIRNFSNPAACGQPDHFSQYTPLPYDNGGVHIYSGIHNLAAYNVLTAKDPVGDYIFSPSEVAILYYLTLTRLTRLSDFSDCRRTLLNVAGVYYASDATERTLKQDAIRKAYNAVGII